MKKSLLALATISAFCFAGSASATEVEMYGAVDTGINLSKTKGKEYKNGKLESSETTNAVKMTSGQYKTSRWGIKGKEDLGQGWTVGFNLDSGFEADTGELKKGRLFNREAKLYIKGPYGEIGMGRYGALDSGNGSYGFYDETFTPFGTGWDDVGDPSYVLLGNSSRQDNMFTYRSPKFNGVTAYLQASPNMNSVAGTKGDFYTSSDYEGTSKATRYYAAGLKGDFGALDMGITYSQTDIGSNSVNLKKDGSEKTFTAANDRKALTAGIGYDFKVIRPVLMVQYYNTGLKDTGVKGYGAVIGFSAPALGGNIYALAGYGRGKQIEGIGMKVHNQIYAAGYDYKLSKRTSLYTALGYYESQEVNVKKGTGIKETESSLQFMAGIAHKF